MKMCYAVLLKKIKSSIDCLQKSTTNSEEINIRIKHTDFVAGVVFMNTVLIDCSKTNMHFGNACWVSNSALF